MDNTIDNVMTKFMINNWTATFVKRTLHQKGWGRGLQEKPKVVAEEKVVSGIRKKSKIPEEVRVKHTMDRIHFSL